MKAEEVKDKLQIHKIWIETNGKEGTKFIAVNANLTWADLTWADLTGATLTGADLREADLREVTYNASTIFPEGFDLKERLHKKTERTEGGANES